MFNKTVQPDIVNEVVWVDKMQVEIDAAKAALPDLTCVIIAIPVWNAEVRQMVNELLGQFRAESEGGLYCIGTTMEQKVFSGFAKGPEGEGIDVIQMEHFRSENLKEVELNYMRQIETLRKDYDRSVFIVDRHFTEHLKRDGAPVSEIYRYALRTSKCRLFNLPEKHF